MRIGLVAALVLAFPARTEAAPPMSRNAEEPRFVVVWSIGGAYERSKSFRLPDFTDEREDWGMGITLDLEYQVVSGLALGAHLAGMRTWRSQSDSLPCREIEDVYQGLASLAVSYTVNDLVRIAPFIGQLGERSSFSRAEGDCRDYGFSAVDTARRFAYGLELGADVRVWRRHTVGVVLQLAKARENHVVDTYGTEYEQNAVISLGVGGRLW